MVVPPDHGVQKDLFTADDVVNPRLAAQMFTGSIDREWRVSSYSALSRHSTAYIPDLPGLDLEVVDEATQLVEVEIPEGRNIFTFPKGANAGTFLHSIFEEISFPRGLSTRRLSLAVC